MKLTVANGYPIADFEQGRDGTQADLKTDEALWYERGLALAPSSSFGLLYADSILSGNHPRRAFEIALDILGITYDFDTFLTEYKNETTPI